MTAQELLNALDAAQEDLLSEADLLRTAPRKKKASGYIWLAVAACLCLLCCGGWFMGKQMTSAPSEPDMQAMDASNHLTAPSANLPATVFHAETMAPFPTEDGILLDSWIPYYNESTIFADGALREDVFLFSADLTEEELRTFIPPKRPEWMSLRGYGVFLGDGTLRQVSLLATTSLPEVTATVTIGAQEPYYFCYILPENPRISYCNGVEYTLTRYTAPDGSIALFGEAKIGNCYYTFSLQGTEDTRAQTERDFALILQSFADSHVSPEDLAAIHPREIPVMFDKSLSYEEALDLSPYGSYFLPQLPHGFQEESIRHYQDLHTSYLSGLWTKGYDELSWRVSVFTEEQDHHRLTHAGEAERYDLSLYPIPRADSVPEDLREVVDNPIFYGEELSADLVWARAYKSGEQGDSNGWRMAFSVLYGDMIVTVRCKGVDPDWLFEQLSSLRS